MFRRVVIAGFTGAVVVSLVAACSDDTSDTGSGQRRGAATAQAAQAPHGDAIPLLNTLLVRERAPQTGYDRDEFGPAWSDEVSVSGGGNGCDTRNDILQRDLTAVTLKPGTCQVATGTLNDPYTGKTIDFTRGLETSSAVQIDHVVALSDAWQKGAQQLSTERRRDLANDPLNLLAVDGPTNQAKSDSDAAEWLPPNAGYHLRLRDEANPGQIGLSTLDHPRRKICDGQCTRRMQHPRCTSAHPIPST